MNVIEEKGFKYVDEGKREGEILLLLHGLFGALSNWSSVINHFTPNYRIFIPLLPIYEMPIRESDLEGLVKYLEDFVHLKGIENMNLLGNSLGGHVGLLYTLKYPAMVNKLILIGSSGLFENSMGGSFPRRGSYDYIKERVEYTFYDPKTADKKLVDEVFETTKSIPKCLRIVSIAKSAQRNNLASELHKIKAPTLLIWGLNDTITPPMVAHDFNKQLPDSKLRFVDKCCHAPMMEQPEKFNKLLEEFL